MIKPTNISSSHSGQKTYPDFSEYGYQIEGLLGQNQMGGRVTYKAIHLISGQPVVIKQFQFIHANWAEYENYEREIQVLKQLNHPSIPRYLNEFETSTGFCLVTEYKQAPSLARQRNFTPQQIQEIAIAILEIVVYLQSACPTIIHRDIKPENILVDSSDGIKIYLVDFGFADISDGDISASSVVKGTLGFMPPEQMFNRQLTKASDLYSIGVTLLCLLTGTKSTEVGSLIDEANQIKVKKLKLQLNRKFIGWLKKMVSPNPQDRYANSDQALKALKKIEVIDDRSSISFANIKCWLETVNITQLLFTEEPTIDWLKNADLRGANLEYLDLRLACYQNIDLSLANLRFACLKDADLRNANLQGANLEGADLRNANLQGANLEGANLEKANLEKADLLSANLKNANLKFAKLWDVNLENANLEGANLIRTSLWDADLSNANLNGAYLVNTNLRGANLRNSKLDKAYLRGVNFRKAIMPYGGLDNYLSLV